MNRQDMMHMMQEARKQQLQRRQEKVRKKYGKLQKKYPQAERDKRNKHEQSFNSKDEFDVKIPLAERRKLRRRRLRAEAVKKRVAEQETKTKKKFDAKKGLEKISILLDLERQRDQRL